MTSLTESATICQRETARRSPVFGSRYSSGSLRVARFYVGRSSPGPALVTPENGRTRSHPGDCPALVIRETVRSFSLRRLSGPFSLRETLPLVILRSAATKDLSSAPESARADPSLRSG